MPLYKFYRIVPKDVSKTDCYIGHTIQPLRKRFTAHCQPSNTTSSKMLIENYGKDAVEIVLIHELELPDKEFARREERRLYEEVKERAVNKMRPYVTHEERKEQMKEQHKQYHEANRVAELVYKKQYHEANRERENARRKQNHARDSALKYLRHLLD